MITINLPNVRRLLDNQNGNQIWQHYSQGVLLEDVRLLSREPFVITSGGIKCLLTSNENLDIPNEYEYVLLVTKQPKNKDLETGTIKAKRWLKHPKFGNLSPEQVVSSWENKFKFIQEDEANNIKGLRPPQMGALYSILSHLQNPEDKGIVVMPTGTGKTETMLATLISNKCKKLLVSVPSDSLRTQISEKFITLGLLKEYGIVDEDCHNPIVGIINSGITDMAILRDFISKVNVVVTTMDILTDSITDAKTLFSQEFSHLFVDEAHHSEARTWKELIERFDKEKVFLFTATPYRNDGKNLQGKIIFNFSLRKAQEQKYYKQINYLPIREYNRKLADEKIAERAVQQLRKDIANGYNHIIMARCKDKIRAKEVFKHYEQYEDLNPVMVYTNIGGLDRVC
jgi:superfamily II DNA or RNA helicase